MRSYGKATFIYMYMLLDENRKLNIKCIRLTPIAFPLPLSVSLSLGIQSYYTEHSEREKK